MSKCHCNRFKTFDVCINCNMFQYCGCDDYISFAECAQCYFNKLKSRHICPPKMKSKKQSLLQFDINLTLLKELCESYGKKDVNIKEHEINGVLFWLND